MANLNTDLSGTRGSLSLPTALPPQAAQIRRLEDRITSLEQGLGRSNALNMEGLVFGSGWTDYLAGYKPLTVTRAGGLIVLTGLVKRTSGVGTLIGTLPVKARPTYLPSNGTLLFSVHTDTGAGRVDIDTAGQIYLMSGGAGYLSLSGIVFPT